MHSSQAGCANELSHDQVAEAELLQIKVMLELKSYFFWEHTFVSANSKLFSMDGRWSGRDYGHRSHSANL